MRKALLVGINYKNTPFGLNGCINDIDNIQKFLKTNRKYTEFIRLSDNGTDELPTRDKIINGIKSLVQNVKFGDELWFHYSGHGVLQRDRNNDEESGFDSCICPLDFERSGYITDDVLRSLLVIPEGVKLYVVLDACHSGTGCDLRYKLEDFSYYSKTDEPTKYVPSDWVLKQTVTQFKKYRKSRGDIVMISGCKDDQTSADALEENTYTGALTYCILKTLKNNFGNCKWKIFLKDLKCLLKVKGYDQIPLITSGKQLNTDLEMFQQETSKSIDKYLSNLNVNSIF